MDTVPFPIPVLKIRKHPLHKGDGLGIDFAVKRSEVFHDSDCSIGQLLAMQAKPSLLTPQIDKLNASDETHICLRSHWMGTTVDQHVEH